MNNRNEERIGRIEEIEWNTFTKYPPEIGEVISTSFNEEFEVLNVTGIYVTLRYIGKSW